MKKLSKKAFTLIEILAAVTILGILSIVAIISVNKIIQRAKNEHYKTAEKNFTLAAQSYVQQNRKELPKVIGQRKEIKLKTLLDNNYIEEIKNYNKKDCYPDTSYVQVFKYSQTDYSYIAVLKCPNYEGNSIVTGEKTAGIDINFDKSADVKDANATIKITDENKIFSYSYTVYRNGKEVKNSGDQFVENYDTEVTKKLKLDEYAPGKIKIVVTATNIYGIPTTTTNTHEFKDLNPPKCVILDEQDENENRTWTNQDRKITIGCDDGRGTGCTRQTYSKTFKNDISEGTIIIKDESGRTTKCTVIVHLDKTPPTCSVSGGNTSWTNGSRTIKATCSDTGGSKCATADFSTTYNTTMSITTAGAKGNSNGGSVSDRAGNITNCAANQTVKIDKIAPSCSVSGGSSSWTNGSRTITGTCSDTGGSGCVGNISKVYDTNTNSTTAGAAGLGSGGSVKDNAGNVTNCAANQTVKVDVTKPTISWSTSAGPHQDSDGGTFTVKTTCTDALSGVASHTGSSTVSSPTAGTKKTHYCTDNAGNSVSTSRTFKVQIFSADATACGYKSCVSDQCECDTWGRCSLEGCEKFASWDCDEWTRFFISERNDGTCPGGEKSEKGTYTVKISDYEKEQYKDCQFNTIHVANDTYREYKYRKCTRNCDTYNRGSKCYCEKFQSCVNSDCDAESCWHY